jgi:uncharacterized protein (DUF305 family)
MSDKLRRGCLVAAVFIASQALAQQTHESRPRQSTTDHGTATDTTRATNAAMSKTVSPQGAVFDKEYAKAMVKRPDQAVALFEAASQNSQMPSELKEFAAGTLPALKEHDDMAHSLHAKQGG